MSLEGEMERSWPKMSYVFRHWLFHVRETRRETKLMQNPSLLLFWALIIRLCVCVCVCAYVVDKKEINSTASLFFSLLLFLPIIHYSCHKKSVLVVLNQNSFAVRALVTVTWCSLVANILHAMHVNILERYVYFDICLPSFNHCINHS